MRSCVDATLWAAARPALKLEFLQRNQLECLVVNRVLPESIAERILLKVGPWRVRSGKSGKFPAFYHWCYGPTTSQIRRFASAGFAIEHCVAYFGEPSPAPGRLLTKVDSAWTQLMLRHPSYHFTSYATYTLQAR